MSYAMNCERAETGPNAEPETAAPNPNRNAPGFGCVYLTRSVREAKRASALVESARIRIYHASGLADALERLTITGSRVLMTDTAFERGNWRDALQVVAGLRPPAELVVAARLADERLWLGVLERGAYDLIVKPFQKDELCRVLENAHNHAIAGGSRRMTA